MAKGNFNSAHKGLNNTVDNNSQEVSSKYCTVGGLMRLLIVEPSEHVV